MTQENDIETLQESILSGYDNMKEIETVQDMSTHNKGVVITMVDGSEFQLPIYNTGIVITMVDGSELQIPVVKSR